MKFNMGCGSRKLAGFVNVDAYPGAEPDVVFDLETTPWPWPSGCAEEVRFIHSMEHMGADAKVFLAIIKELYRICAPDAEVVIHVPHPRHDNFVGDPTHVRAITPQTLSMFDRTLNDQWKAAGGANTPLAYMTGVDFVMVRADTVLEDAYFKKMQDGDLTREQIEELVKTQANIVRDYQMVMKARKAA